ncbi:MAG: hypothetical protein WCJ09_08720 [Planctomycetota bacterium]
MNVCSAGRSNNERVTCCCRWQVYALGFVFLMTSLAAAADRPLEIEQSNMQPPIQVGRPIPSWWDVKVRGTGLLEGHFEFRLKNDPELLSTLVTEEMALSGPQQRIRVMLPPANDQNPVDQLTVDIKFIGKKFTQDLGRHILRVALSRSRTFMVLVPMSRIAQRRSVERDRIIRRLSFENLISGLDDSTKTVQASLEPADLPQEPLAYCAYEMVVLFQDEFRALKKPQLEAMATWIRAGGSLYVEPTGILEPYHLDFLRELAKSTPDVVITSGADGRLVPGTIRNDERLIRMRNSLGRIVMRVDEEEVEADETTDWREAASFLFRIHADQANLIRNRKISSPAELMVGRPIVYQNDINFESRRRLEMKFPASTRELLDCLKPAGVRMVPLWVLVVILTAFVVVIGPVDYFVLGRLRARKYTWVTFPIATILVTWLTVSLTNSYMSTAEARRGLVIHDLGDDGSTVRVNRFELLFLASTRTVSTDVRKGIFSALKTGATITNEVDPSGQFRPGVRPGRMAPMDGNRTRETLTGRIPTDYTASQPLSKWTPQLNRLFYLPGPSEQSPLNWAQIMEGESIRSTLNDQAAKQRILARVQQQLGRSCAVCWIGPAGAFSYQLSPDWKDSVFTQYSHNSGDPYSTFDYEEQMFQQELPQDVRNQPSMLRWLYQNSVATPHGLFCLTSQVGPAGGAQFEDLPIFDSWQQNQMLMIVVVQRGDDYVVYRKILRDGN